LSTTADPTRSNDGSAAPGFLARLSIGYKLPLMVGVLILAVAAALTMAAYLEVRRSALETATGRLQTVTRRLAEALRSNGRTLPEQARRNAERPEVAAYLRNPQPALRDDALKALEYVGPQPEQLLAVELRDAAGNVLLAAGRAAEAIAQRRGIDRARERPAPAAGVDLDSFPRPQRPDSGLVGEFRLVGDSVVYPVVSLVPGPTKGYVIHWRRLTTTPAALEQFRELVGSGTVYLANATGGLWTDLVAVVPPPPVPVDSLLELASYERPGAEGQFHAMAGRISGTPWLVMLELSDHLALAPAERFLQRMLLIGIVCVATGLVAAWLVSRRIVLPLQNLTKAAQEIAAGDYSRPVQTRRADELGNLASSFASMTDQVREAQQRLEIKVDERTRELNDALTQLRDAQDALVQRERLALLGQLASGVGHELRNPLGVMSNAIYYLDAVLDSPPKNVRDYLDILRQQVALSERIISHLLEFGRTKPPQREVIPLSTIVDTQLKRLPTPDGACLGCEIPATLPPVHVDPVQIGQVVLNLLLNAVQAIDGGGRVSVRGRQVSSDLVGLDVTDTGRGVPAEYEHKIFEPLFTTKARGMGLGLAVSRTLARANGGDITVHSPPGQGATFTLTLPTAPKEIER
jgi:signal transduction histidine kinase